MKNNDDKYRAIFESSRDSMIILDRSGFLDCNRAALETYGFSTKRDLIGRHPADLAPPIQPDGRASMPLANEMINRAFQEGSCFFEWSYCTKEGVHHDSEVLLSRFEAHGDEFLQAAVRDISERKFAEKQLKESEANYRSIFEAANDGIAIHDIDTGNIIEVNRKHSEMFGYTAEEIRAGGNVDLLSIGESPYTNRDALLWMRRAADGEPQLIEWKAKDRSGRVFWSEINIKRVVIGGRERLLALIRDITERKRAEDALRKSREQLRNLTSHLELVREEERRHIAREIHDELGQALTVLKMNASLINKKLPKGQSVLEARVKDMSELIDSTIEAVQRISTDLRPRLLDDLGLIAALEWHVDEFQKRTGLRCLLEVSEVHDTDLNREQSTTLFRIFQEALTNVFRHADADSIQASLREEDALVLEVKDDGKGITEEQISDPESFGLLGIRERVSYLGGVFEVRGIPGKGTIIKAKIPLVKREDIDA